MKIRIICLLLIVTAICSCTTEEVYRNEVQDINLSARVETSYEVEVHTRAESATEAMPYMDSIPSIDNPLEAMIWLSTTPGLYKDEPVAPTYLPKHASINFNASTPVFPNEHKEGNVGYKLKYPEDNSNVYCVGLYPNSLNWTTDDGTEVSHVISGTDDIMFSPEIYGNRRNQIGQQRYHHLLTWLKVCAWAENEQAINDWGEIEYIKVLTKTGVKIDLSKTKVDLNDAENNAVIYFGEGELVSTQNKPLYTTLQQVGSIFCAPDTEYTLLVKGTRYNTEKELPIKLNTLADEPITNLDYCRGKLFVLELTFKAFSKVEGVCVLNDWDTQDDVLFPK